MRMGRGGKKKGGWKKAARKFSRARTEGSTMPKRFAGYRVRRTVVTAAQTYITQVRHRTGPGCSESMEYSGGNGSRRARRSGRGALVESTRLQKAEMGHPQESEKQVPRMHIMRRLWERATAPIWSVYCGLRGSIETSCEIPLLQERLNVVGTWTRPRYGLWWV